MTEWIQLEILSVTEVGALCGSAVGSSELGLEVPFPRVRAYDPFGCSLSHMVNVWFCWGQAVLLGGGAWGDPALSA